MDTLLMILLALTTVAIPVLTETAAAAHIFDAWGTRGFCVRTRLKAVTGLSFLNTVASRPLSLSYRLIAKIYVGSGEGSHN